MMYCDKTIIELNNNVCGGSSQSSAASPAEKAVSMAGELAMLVHMC